MVNVYDDRGNRLTAHEYRIGSDPVLTFRAPKSGEYRLMIGHLGFQGGPHYVYRATLSAEPYVPFIFPPGAMANHNTEVEALHLTELGTFESHPISLRSPNVSTSAFLFDGGASNRTGVAFSVDEYPSVLDAEPNNALPMAQRLPQAACVYGRFLDANDEDWYLFQADEGTLWSIDCQRFPVGGDCLPILTIANADGAILATASSAEDVKGRCQLQWRAPANGTYAIRLRDVQQGVRGGPDFIYRLEVAAAKAGFELSLASDFVNVVQGAKAEVEIKALRKGGFVGPIDLAIEGLPEGVRFEPNQITAAQELVKVALIADDKARSCDVTLRIRGSASHNEEKLSALARATHLGRDSDGVSRVHLQSIMCS